MTVRPQRSNSNSSAELKSLYNRGEFTEFARAYDAAPVPAVDLFRARVYLKSDPPAAIAFLSGLEGRKIEPARDMLLGTAYSRIGEFETADEYFARAEPRATAAGIQAEYLYHLARRLLAENRNNEAREYAARLAKLSGGENLALHLESFALSQEHRYGDQALVLIELLQRLSPGAPETVEMRAWATHSLAALARELYVPEALPLVERHLEGDQWPVDFAINRFQAVKALGWARALQGDYFNGFRFLKQAADIAPDLAWKVVSLADRAYLARCIGEPRWSRQELDEAETVASRVDWHATKNEERIALLLLAELFAPLDPSKAAQFLARHSELPALRSPLVHFRFDDRLQAIADYSTGIVHTHAGNSRIALSAFKRSRAAFERFGYDWRAGRTVLAIFDLTKDLADLQAAEERLRHYDSSWLGEELNRRAPSRYAAKLTPTQQRVFEMLCEGQNPAQIAKRMSRSENTVKNHIKVIFRACGVNSRSELIAEAARRRS